MRIAVERPEAKVVESATGTRAGEPTSARWPAGPPAEIGMHPREAEAAPALAKAKLQRAFGTKLFADQAHADRAPPARPPVQYAAATDVGSLDDTEQLHEIKRLPMAPVVQLAAPGAGGPVFDPQIQAALAKQGTSANVGKFEGLQGATIEEVVSRVPSNWTAKPTEGLPGAHFADPKNPGNAIRVHGPDSNAPPNTNSSSGWTVRVVKSGNYFDDQGNNLTKALGGKAARQADAGHIPLAGNPKATQPAKPVAPPPALPSGQSAPGSPGSPPAAGGAQPPKVATGAGEAPHPVKPAPTTGPAIPKAGGGVKAPGLPQAAEDIAETTSKLSRLMRGFGKGMKLLFSSKVQVPLAVALEVLAMIDAMSMASSALAGEGFIFREELKKIRELEKEVKSLLSWYEGYHDDLEQAVTLAIACITLGASAEARATIQEQAAEILPSLQERAQELDKLSRKISAIREEADKKARIAEQLLNSKEFALLTAPTGSVALTNVHAAREDLIQIRGAASNAKLALTKLTQLIQEDIANMNYFL